MLVFSLVFFQVIIFAVLIVVFRRILNSNVMSATKHLDDLSREYDKKDKEITRRLEEAKKKSEEIIAKARIESEKQKERIVKDAQLEMDRMLKQARTQSEEIIQQADKSRNRLIAEINERIAKEAINKACELIQSTLPLELKQGVHTQWTEELISQSFDQLKNLQIPRDVQDVRVITAFPLSETQRKNLGRNLKQLLNREVKIQEETDTTIVAGIIVMVGSLVLDGSLKNKIQEQAKLIEHESGG